MTGKYFVKQEPVQWSDVSYDTDVALRLWQASEELVRWLTLKGRCVTGGR